MYIVSRECQNIYRGKQQQTIINCMSWRNIYKKYKEVKQGHTCTFFIGSLQQNTNMWEANGEGLYSFLPLPRKRHVNKYLKYYTLVIYSLVNLPIYTLQIAGHN